MASAGPRVLGAQRPAATAAGAAALLLLLLLAAASPHPAAAACAAVAGCMKLDAATCECITAKAGYTLLPAGAPGALSLRDARTLPTHAWPPTHCMLLQLIAVAAHTRPFNGCAQVQVHPLTAPNATARRAALCPQAAPPALVPSWRQRPPTAPPLRAPSCPKLLRPAPPRPAFARHARLALAPPAGCLSRSPPVGPRICRPTFSRAVTAHRLRGCACGTSLTTPPSSAWG